jgi:hypothetical protein
MASKVYYKVVCDQEGEAGGAGIGYEELFGDSAAYFWTRDEADRVAARLNDEQAGAETAYTYRVERRAAYDDGSWDDEGDEYAVGQLGLGVK